MADASAIRGTNSGRWRPPLPERLPNLKGKWLTLYTIVWAILFPLAIGCALRGAYILLTIQPMWSPYGISSDDRPEGLIIDAVMSAEARAAGIRSGDRVIAVDGHVLHAMRARSAARTLVLKPDGSTTQFRFRRPSGETFEVRLVRSMAFDRQRFSDAGVSWPLAWTLQRIDVFLLPVLFLTASGLIFFRRRREAVPALLSLSFLIYGAMVNGADLIGIPAQWLRWLQPLAASTMLMALLAFPSGRFEPKWSAAAFFLTPILAFVDLPDAIEFATFTGTLVACVAALVVRYRKVGEGAERQQLRWAFFGLVAGLLLFLVAAAGDAASIAWKAADPRWLVWDFAILQFISLWGLGIMALGLIVSILRYRLYDADAIIGRSAAYGVLTVGFVALFAASQKVIELLGEEYLGQSMGALAGGIGAALAAVAIAPMHARAQRWAERRFQKALYRLRYGLPPLVGDLRETSGVEQIAGATLDSLLAGVRASRAALVAGEQLIDAREIPANEVEQWRSHWAPSARDGIDCDEADPVFPVRVPLEAEGHGRVGWLLLGPRPDGSLFGKAERLAIEEVAEPVARAVQVALSREEREAGYERRFAALENLVAKLGAKPKPSAT